MTTIPCLRSTLSINNIVKPFMDWMRIWGGCWDYLDESGLSQSTLVVYMGDNGFALGEHGFYDKRDAFEESIRVPMLAYAPGLIEPGSRISQMVQNIDIAPTLLEAAGRASARESRDGRPVVYAIASWSISSLARSYFV